MNHCACWIWTLELSFFSHILSCGYAKPRFALLSSTKVKSTKELYMHVTPGALEKWDSKEQNSSCPILWIVEYSSNILSAGKDGLKSRVLYYNNSVATFNLSEITIARSGDVHPMPDPDSGSTMTIITRITNRSRRQYQSHYCPPSSRNNLITIQCSNRLTADRCKQQLVACNINGQSVRDKSVVIFDYICDHTPAIVTLTEHWLTDLDSSVRAELCPNGYKILDHNSSDRLRGGTGIIYH